MTLFWLLSGQSSSVLQDSFHFLPPMTLCVRLLQQPKWRRVTHSSKTLQWQEPRQQIHIFACVCLHNCWVSWDTLHHLVQPWCFHSCWFNPGTLHLASPLATSLRVWCDCSWKCCFPACGVREQEKIDDHLSRRRHLHLPMCTRRTCRDDLRAMQSYGRVLDLLWY